LVIMLSLLLFSSSAWQPLSPLGWPSRPLTPRAVPFVPRKPMLPARSGSAQALLPKAAALVIFLPWTVQIGYALEKGAGVEDGPFKRFVKSDFMQKGGPTMKRVDRKAPPKVKAVKLDPAASAITQTFKKDYPRKDLELLWAALLKCYGDKALALEAAYSNPQMLNPSYSFPNTMLASKEVLLSMMSKEEALEVMQLNPAVLQCGPSLDVLGATEIMGIARLRSLGNTLIPPQLRVAAVGFFLSLLVAVVVISQADDPDVLALGDGLRPVLGGGLSAIFLFVLYGAANAGRSAKSAEDRSERR